MYAASWQATYAQVKPATTANIYEPKPLSLGDTIPENLWNVPLQVVNHPQGKKTITLADFKGKLIIIDFWATWCPPCIESLMKLDAVQKDFKSDFTLIPITNDKAQIADKFLKSRKLSLPSVINASNLQKIFPHKYIPHYIWINTGGEIVAITDELAVTKANIKAKAAGKPIDLPFKNDLLTFDSSQPLFLNGNGGNGNSIKYRSLFSAPIAGLNQLTSSVITDSIKKVSRIYCINCNISMLYRLAYHKIESFPENRIILDVKDPSKYRYQGNKYEEKEWNQKNRYTYELITPINTPDKVRAQMASDLHRFFGFNTHFDSRMTDCYVVSALPELKNHYTHGGSHEDNLFDQNAESKYINNLGIGTLVEYLGQILPFPVFDETNCQKRLDLTLPHQEHVDFKQLQVALRHQGISIEKIKKELKFFIISDH